MKVSELQLLCKYDDSVMDEFKTCHPKQIASDMIPIPVSKIKYKYLTNRGNPKEAIRYMFFDESEWDSVENEFFIYINSENEKHPERKISNVEILDIDFIGKIYIELE